MERMLNVVLWVSILLTIGSLATILLLKPPPKFYSVFFFCLAYTGGLLHLRTKYFVEEEWEKELSDRLRKAEAKDSEIREYLMAKKELEIYRSWLIMTILIALIVAFVYLIIP